MCYSFSLKNDLNDYPIIKAVEDEFSVKNLINVLFVTKTYMLSLVTKFSESFVGWQFEYK